MPIKTVDKSKVERQWFNKIFFPKDNYVIRVIDQENKPSKSDKPMTKLEFEIVNCAPKQIGQEGIISFDGVTFTKYYVTGDPNDAKASDRWFAQMDELLNKAGIDTSNGWDPENTPNLIGKVFHAQLYGKQSVQYADQTEEEKKAKAPKRVLVDPVTGKESVSYQIEVGQIYGLCTDEVRPF